MLIEHREIVRAATELEALPATASRLASLLSRSDWDMKEVVETVSFDQALTPKLLRLANSALHSRGHVVSTVRDAVVRLGGGAVVSLAMAAGMQKRLQRAVPQYGLAEGELWAHSVAAALATQALDAASEVSVPPESFTAALLHDVGKLVMSRFLDVDRCRVLTKAENEGGLSRRQAEADVLGVDHAELGAISADHWNLPERLATAIQYHHTPSSVADPIASVVHVADVVAHKAQALTIGVIASSAPSSPEPAALEALRLVPSQLDQVAIQVGNELSDVLRRYA
jgi:putative nucleotidyltransferase with HDIG domain